MSIIMPTYNRAYIIGRAIESVRAQTEPDWELVIVDDGSTDETKERIAQIGDPRIRYFFQENAGPIHARNNALTHARGEWISYLDSDDEFYPTFVEVMLQHLKADDRTRFAFPQGQRIVELYIDGQLVASQDETEADSPAQLTAQDIVHRKVHGMMQGFTHSRKTIADGLRFDPLAFGHEDWDYMLSMCAAYPDGFLYVPVQLFTYKMRLGSDGLVTKFDYAHWAHLFDYIFQKHKHDPLMPGQTWHPRLVEKWQARAEEFAAGKLPPCHLYNFKEHWPQSNV